MKKNKLISSFGGAIAVSMLSAPLAQAAENPFALNDATQATLIAQAADKSAEGKCSDGKCGDKMKEGACSGAMEKAKEGKCGEGKCGEGKMMEGGCSGKMEAPAGDQ